MLSKELEKCRSQLTAVTGELEESKKAPNGKVNYCSENTIMHQQCL